MKKIVNNLSILSGILFLLIGISCEHSILIVLGSALIGVGLIVRRISYIIQKIINMFFYHPLPSPKPKELTYISELKTAFSDLPTMKMENLHPSEAAWSSNMNRLKELVINQDPRKFLKWDVIRNTMFIGYANYISTELKYLKSHSDWNKRWKSAIKESFVGHPTPYRYYPKSSGSLIHYTYHIAQFEEKTKTKVQNLDFIFEFGGGYGGMCRLIHELGFRGKYLIFDLPHFSLLQNYYLKTLDLPVLSINDFNNLENGIACISDSDLLRNSLSKNAQIKNKMFLATWSISEAPGSIRDTIFPLVSDFQSFLIAYQNEFGEINNIDFFGNWIESMSHIAWNNWEINHLLGSKYLIGKSNEDPIEY